MRNLCTFFWGDEEEEREWDLIGSIGATICGLLRWTTLDRGTPTIASMCAPAHFNITLHARQNHWTSFSLLRFPILAHVCTHVVGGGLQLLFFFPIILDEKNY